MLSSLLLFLGASSGALGALRLVMEDNFNTLDTSKWEHEVTLGGGGNWEFQAYTPEPKNTYVQNNRLYIKPTLTSDKYGEAFLTNGVWDMYQKYGKCTTSQWYGCKREGKHGTLNPVMSGKLKSKQTIKYGKVEVIAKLPRGDWLWPAIWMLPRSNAYGTWPRSGEIDICEARGNVNFGNIGIDQMAATLHWSVNSNSQYWRTTGSRKSVSSVTFADGFHKYVLDWDENGIKVYVDDYLVLNTPTPQGGYYSLGQFKDRDIWAGRGNDAPFNQDFYLILNVAVGGTNGYFPDGLLSNGKRKPWSNQSSVGPKEFWAGRYEWEPTWNGDDAAMQVKSVKMWQKV